MRAHEQGSSPLTRGKRLTIRRASTAHEAHPRSRGENPPDRRGPLASQGSSPLTRGKRAKIVTATNELGLIPAHAGKTEFRHEAFGSREAHPRSRGENLTDSFLGVSVWGSSPLTRGKRYP